MAAWDWTPFLIGGGTRPDAMSGLDPAFSAALERMFSAAPTDIQGNLRVNSAYRSPEVQAGLWDDALAKYGSPEEARKWVAPPGKSQHNHGNAADLKYLDPTAKAWAHENASKYGLSFPLGNEDWHIELATARGGQPLTFGGDVPPVQGGLLPKVDDTFSLGEPVGKEATIWDRMAAIGKGMQQQPQAQAAQAPQMNRTPYTYQKRDISAPYLDFFASLRK